MAGPAVSGVKKRTRPGWLERSGSVTACGDLPASLGGLIHEVASRLRSRSRRLVFLAAEVLQGRAVAWEDADHLSKVGLGRKDELPELDLDDAEREVELQRGIVQPRDLLLQGGEREGTLEVGPVESAKRQHGEADGLVHHIWSTMGADGSAPHASTSLGRAFSSLACRDLKPETGSTYSSPYGCGTSPLSCMGMCG